MTDLHHDISQFCATLGKDHLWVQGAGGNASWKENEVLWVKGSGTWLANADTEEVFVPVNLTNLSNALSQENFDIKPQVIGEHQLRPSIETILHALMPQKIVFHLHAIDVLSYLVTQESQSSIERLFQKKGKPSLQAAFVGYHKPGPQLAQAVCRALQQQKNTNVIFLKSHGIVVGGNSISEIQALLQSITEICQPQLTPNSIPPSNTMPSVCPEVGANYIAFPNLEVQQLALDPCLYKRLQSDWVLFPDHVVFLGPKAFTFSSWAEFLAQQKKFPNLPELLFIENIGVYVKPQFNLAKTAQLRCYYDVISRVAHNANLDPLNATAIDALLNWDAEKFRQQISK